MVNEKYMHSWMFAIKFVSLIIPVLLNETLELGVWTPHLIVTRGQTHLSCMKSNNEIVRFSM